MDGYISLLDGDVLYVSDYIIAECIFPLGFKQLLNLSNINYIICVLIWVIHADVWGSSKWFPPSKSLLHLLLPLPTRLPDCLTNLPTRLLYHPTPPHPCICL